MPRGKKTAKLAANLEPPRIGVISQLFRGDPSEVATVLVQNGLESVQILPSFPGLNLETAEDVTTSACESIAAPFQESGLLIAAVSAHTNFVDPDRQRRKRAIKRFDALVDHCQELGTKYLITESGTLNATRPWDDHPENHQPDATALLLKSIRPSVKLAEAAGVTILFEGHLYHIISSIATALQVRGELGDNIGFVLDPVNYFTRSMASASKKPLRELFDSLGPHSPVAHGKDVRYVGSELTTPRAGTGTLDYREFLELLGQHHPGGPLILEQITPAELRETLDFLDRFYE
jgi:sugar phosphate isomerase/epimerase